MNRSDRARWASARTLADLGELTAQWIEGNVGERPGYCGPSDLDDPETLAPVCAALCRAGFMTAQSQAGESGPGFDGAHWDQRAAVEGFASASVAAEVTYFAAHAGLAVIACGPGDRPRWLNRYRMSVPVTLREGQLYTGFGVRLSRCHLRSPVTGYGTCHPHAVAALCSAWQLTVIDPEWGRPGLLWDVLDGICAKRAAA